MSKTKPGASRKSSFSRSEKIAIPIIIIIAIWVVYSLSQPAVPSSSTTSIQTTGTLGAADFTLPIVSGSGLTGQTLTLSSLRGKVVLLEFMEPWCPHCQDMAPVLEKLYTQYGSGNVVLLSIAGPWQGATAQDAANFIKNYGSSWSFVYDSSGSVVSEYGVSATPTFLIIGKDGSIVARYDGEQTFDTLAAGLTAALAAPS
ncbi:MAG: TlpA disulfide reductase family protein [Candidatus Bathyarchaeia archaeon]|jgi:cytochrome c-type biogenesis protein